MEQNSLDLLKRCYAGSQVPVVLADESWNILWQNRPMELGYLPKLLGIPEDHRESSVHSIRFGERCYSAQLLYDPEEGIRIITFFPAPAATLPMETELMSNVAHSLHSLSEALYQVFDQNELYDEMYLLSGLRGNCMRLFRPAYLQKELERCQAGLWHKEAFSVQQQLMEIHERMQRILGRTADLKLELCEEMPFVCGDIDAFQIAVLSGLVRCFHDTEHRLGIGLKLEAQERSCCITVSITPTPELRTDIHEQVGDFGSTHAEEMLLGRFCEACGGSFLEGTSGETAFCQITLPCTRKACSSLMTMHGRQEGRFFNKFEIMLARIHLLR